MINFMAKDHWEMKIQVILRLFKVIPTSPQGLLGKFTEEREREKENKSACPQRLENQEFLCSLS